MGDTFSRRFPLVAPTEAALTCLQTEVAGRALRLPRGREGTAIDGVVLQTEPSGNASDQELGESSVHISCIPVAVAGMVVGLPEAPEIGAHEYIDWELRDARPRFDEED